MSLWQSMDRIGGDSLSIGKGGQHLRRPRYFYPGHTGYAGRQSICTSKPLLFVSSALCQRSTAAVVKPVNSAGGVPSPSLLRPGEKATVLRVLDVCTTNGLP